MYPTVYADNFTLTRTKFELESRKTLTAVCGKDFSQKEKRMTG